jgi:uncharacterized membrane protein
LNPVHVHLVANHIPIVLTGTGLLFLLMGGLGSRRDLTTGGQWLLVLALVGLVPTVLSGEPAERAIEHLAGVDEATIEQHEEQVLSAIILTAVAGLLALAGLWNQRGERAPSKALARAAALAALASFVALVATGVAGGRIRHPEIAGRVALARTIAGATTNHSYAIASTSWSHNHGDHDEHGND